MDAASAACPPWRKDELPMKPVRKTTEAIEALARITQAAERLTAHLHHSTAATDPEGEIAHMRLNLDLVAEQVTPVRDIAARGPKTLASYLETTPEWTLS
jgi:hypothetical protein